MECGWISIHRKIKDNWIWEEKPFSKGQAWIDLLLMANHADRKILLGNELIEVKRGSFITSEKKLMESWGWGKEKVRRFLKLLEADGMIEKKTDRKKTTINIVNYSVFQVLQTTNRPQTDYQQTDSRPPADTNNNDNNYNNDNNKYFIVDKPKGKIKKFITPTIEDVKAYCVERKNNVDPERFIDYYTSNGWKVGKNPMKDWKAAVRTWERRNNNEGNSGDTKEPTLGDVY